jgi:plasmid stabilization system protein ParE
VNVVRWTERALSDLMAIGDYIAESRPAAARLWVERLRQVAVSAAAAPQAGRVVPELARDDVREVFLRSYRIVYRLSDNGIVVLTVFEGHRLFHNVDPDVAS